MHFKRYLEERTVMVCNKSGCINRGTWFSTGMPKDGRCEECWSTLEPKTENYEIYPAMDIVLQNGKLLQLAGALALPVTICLAMEAIKPLSAITCTLVFILVTPITFLRNQNIFFYFRRQKQTQIGLLTDRKNNLDALPHILRVIGVNAIAYLVLLSTVVFFRV